MENIQVGVQKTQSYLIFFGIVLFMILIGFCFKSCANSPKDPTEPIPSIECTKAGGQWIPEKYENVNCSADVRVVQSYCALNKNN